MKKMFYKMPLWLAMLFLLLGTSACMKSSYNISVDEKGQATAEIKLLGPYAEAAREKIADEYPSCRIEEIRERDLSGYSFAFAPTRLEDLRLPGLLSPSVIKDSNLFYDTYHLSCLSMRQARADNNYRKNLEDLINCLNLDGSVYWSLTLPSEPLRHNAGRCENEGKTLIWTSSDIMSHYAALEACERGETTEQNKILAEEDCMQVSFRIYHIANILSIISLFILFCTGMIWWRHSHSSSSQQENEEPALYGPDDDQG